MTLKELKEIGYASLEQLTEVGFKRNFTHTQRNGFKDSVIIDQTNHQWDLLVDENIYEYKGKASDYWLVQV